MANDSPNLSSAPSKSRFFLSNVPCFRRDSAIPALSWSDLLFDNALSYVSLLIFPLWYSSESINGSPYIGNIFYQNGFVAFTNPKKQNLHIPSTLPNITTSPVQNQRLQTWCYEAEQKDPNNNINTSKNNKEEEMKYDESNKEMKINNIQ